MSLSPSDSCKLECAPFCGGTEEFSRIFNNNTHLTQYTLPFCCYLMQQPPDRDNISCFFNGVSCVGGYPTRFDTDISDTVMSKYNFVNSTESGGYFFIWSGEIKVTLRNSVISFTSPDTFR